MLLLVKLQINIEQFEIDVKREIENNAQLKMLSPVYPLVYVRGA
jgi:hypothetical protein